MKIELFKFNNYTNRRCKAQTPTDAKATYTNINFNPNNDIRTSLILGNDNIIAEDLNVDYLVTTPETSTDLGYTDEHRSRWFIVSRERLRANQYRYHLYRDVLAEFKNSWYNEDGFIERGYINDANKDILYQPENFNCTKTLRSKQQLKDGYGGPWLVGYLNKKVNTTYEFSKINATYMHGSNITLVADVPYILKEAEWIEVACSITEMYKFTAGAKVVCNETVTLISTDITAFQSKVLKVDDTYSSCQFTGSKDLSLQQATDQTVEFNIKYNSLDYLATIEVPRTHIQTIDAPYDMICIPYDSTIAIYNDESTTTYISPSISMQLAQAISAKYAGAGYCYDFQVMPYCPATTPEDKGIVYTYKDPTTSMPFVRINEHTPQHERGAGKVTLKRYVRLYGKHITQDGNFESAIKLPSCIIFCKHAKFSTTSTVTASYTRPSTAQECKVEDATEEWRLVSPSYTSSYSFSATKNSQLSQLNIKCYYKPYKPYIHISPIWAGLYKRVSSGYTGSMPEGLICTDDFSMSKITDAWQTYELENKNYMEIFAHQMHTLDKQNQLNMIDNATSGLISAAGIGVQANAMAGMAGIAGMGTGAAAISLAGAAGGALMDYQQYLNQRNETIFQQNQGWQNISRRPYTINNICALSDTFTFWPTIEHYYCESIEKDYLNNYLNKYGMSVNIVGKISDFIQHYIKCNIIKVDQVNNNIAMAIKDELSQGVYYDT